MAKSRQMMKESALNIGALLGVICFVFAVCAVFFGITPLIFRSGSMSPAIDTGSLALAHTVPASSLTVGDIVSINRTDGSRITHRVNKIQGSTGNSVSVLLKGDANADVDADSYAITEADRVFAHVPFGGYVATWTTTPFAWVLGAGLAAFLLYVAWRPEPSAPRTPSGRHSLSTGIALVAAGATALGMGYAHPDVTEAALSDTATVRPGPLAAGTLPNPTGLVCSGGGALAGSVTLTIGRPVAPVTGFQVVVRNAAGTTSTAPMAFTVPQTGSATAVVTSGLLGALLGGTSYADVRSTAGQWVSPGKQTQTITSFLGVNCNGSATASASRQAVPIPSPTIDSSVANTTAPEIAASTTTATTTPTTTVAPPKATEVPPMTTTSAPTVPTEPVVPAPIVPEPVEPGPAVPETPALPPAPPASAFVSPGSPKSSGEYTASVAQGVLAITDPAEVIVYEYPVSSSERYGTGAVWSSNGSLYILSEKSAPVQLAPSGDGTFVSSTKSTADLPSDIAALL